MGNPEFLATSDASPPPYTESDPHAQVPVYETAGPSAVAATIKFPPALNGYYQWKFTSTSHLGPTAEQKLFAVSTHTTVFSHKPSVVLHDGPTNQHPVMATALADRWGRIRPIELTLPPRPDGPYATEIVESLVPSSSKLTTPTWTFEASVGPKGTTREKFQWRSSHGAEIKNLAGHSCGWKLVRLAETASVGGSRKERDVGSTSDGLEVVAIIAHNASWSMTKGLRFAFLGSGLTGTMGETWEILALTSALQLWYIDVQNNTAAASAAAAA
ncbi:unnamed protein product [Penicillium salamii]|uniref:Uncharacterized protein n=1 Tax=Penicillium salamii TaxID=1612424 RepID=A0A9W4NPC5_9EURO|nr:unnamed protein product [Penicillium salamii]